MTIVSVRANSLLSINCISSCINWHMCHTDSWIFVLCWFMLKDKSTSKCYKEASTLQVAFQLIPGIISCISSMVVIVGTGSCHSDTATVQLLFTWWVLPCLILLGHQAMPGDLNPPSQVEPFPHLKGPALPPRIPWFRSGLERGRREKGA